MPLATGVVLLGVVPAAAVSDAAAAVCVCFLMTIVSPLASPRADRGTEAASDGIYRHSVGQAFVCFSCNVTTRL